MSTEPRTLTPRERRQLRIVELIDDHTDTCDKCDRSIFWAVTVKGKRIPLDHGLVERGKRFTLEPHGVQLGAFFALSPTDPDGYRCHFDTCEAR